MSATNWRIPTDIQSWMRNIEKSIGALQRRPVVQNATDLMGPILGAHAAVLMDWNSDEATFNGFYHIHVEADNTPDPTYGFLGHTIAQANGYGVQIAYPVHDSIGSLTTGGPYIRRFWVPGGSTPRIYTAWALM